MLVSAQTEIGNSGMKNNPPLRDKCPLGGEVFQFWSSLLKRRF